MEQKEPESSAKQLSLAERLREEFERDCSSRLKKLELDESLEEETEQRKPMKEFRCLHTIDEIIFGKPESSECFNAKYV